MIDPMKVSGALTDLMLASHTATLEDLPRMVADHVEPTGLHDVAFFLVDMQGRLLRQLTGRGDDAGGTGLELAVDSTLAGLAFQRVDLITEPDRPSGQGGRRWWVPVTDGVERLGVLRADTAEDDDATRYALRALASV
ncbi:stage II sporulation protein E, partial [Streptomyces sp. NPDC006743]